MSEDIEQIYKRTEQYGRMQFVEEIDKLQCEKQQLISFLEDKINLCDKDIKKFRKNCNVYFRVVEDTIMCKRTYQDVLDFVNKGGKE